MSIWTEEHDDGEIRNKRNKRHKTSRGGCFFSVWSWHTSSGSDQPRILFNGALGRSVSYICGGWIGWQQTIPRSHAWLVLGKRWGGRVVRDAFALILIDLFFLLRPTVLALGGVLFQDAASA